MGGFDLIYKKGEEAKKLIKELKELFSKNYDGKSPPSEDFEEIWHGEDKSIGIQFDLEKEEVYLTLDW